MTTDSRPYIVALEAVLAAALAPAQVYEYRQVPGADDKAGELPDIFALVAISRRTNGNLRMTRQASSTGWRVQVRCLGRTPDEARWALARVATALNEKRLTVADKATTPIQFESDDAPAWDDRRFTAESVWTFAH